MAARRHSHRAVFCVKSREQRRQDRNPVKAHMEQPPNTLKESQQRTIPSPLQTAHFPSPVGSSSAGGAGRGIKGNVRDDVRKDARPRAAMARDIFDEQDNAKSTPADPKARRTISNLTLAYSCPSYSSVLGMSSAGSVVFGWRRP